MASAAAEPAAAAAEPGPGAAGPLAGFAGVPVAAARRLQWRPPMPAYVPPMALSSEADSVAPVVHRNIHALAEVRAAEERRRTFTDRLVSGTTDFVGSMGSVYVHLLFIAGWIVINLGLIRGVSPFDVPPFELLVTIVGIEAIFLSMFVLMTQNRAAVLADRRAELHLQIGLLTEHELTRAVHLLDAMADRLGVRHDDLEDVKRDVRPEHVVEEIVRAEAEEKSGVES